MPWLNEVKAVEGYDPSGRLRSLYFLRGLKLLSLPALRRELQERGYEVIVTPL